MENNFTFSFQTILTFLLFLSYECVCMPVFVLTARRWPLFHNSRYWRSVQGRTYYAKWWSSFPAVEIFAQCKRKQGEIKAWLSIWEQIYTKYVFCKRSHFVEDLQKFLPWNTKVVFHRRSSSIDGCLPSKVIFHWRSSSIECRLPSKVVFHHRSSSIICRLPS